MAWFKGDDKFHDQPELVYLSDSAVCLFWCAVSWSSSVGTDGFVPVGQIPRLKGGRPETAQELCKSYLGKQPWWEEVEGGFQIRSFLKFNPSNARVQAQRKYETERKAAYRNNKCPGGTDSGTDDGTTGGSHTAPVPVPLKREKKEPTVPKKRFVPPTKDECADYAKQIGLVLSEARVFYDFYESKGWKVGKAPMVSWRHAMSGWKTRHDSNPSSNPVKKGSAPKFKDASEVELA